MGSPRKNSSSKVLSANSLKSPHWLVYGFSTRTGGCSSLYGGHALNLGFTRHDSRSAVEGNRETFLRKLDAVNHGEPWPLVTLRQVHSDIIHCVSEKPEQPLPGDGLITATPGLLLAVLTADCLSFSWTRKPARWEFFMPVGAAP